jgi:hypothetical protein
MHQGMNPDMPPSHPSFRPRPWSPLMLIQLGRICHLSAEEQFQRYDRVSRRKVRNMSSTPNAFSIAHMARHVAIAEGDIHSGYH